MEEHLSFNHRMPIQIRFNDVDRYGHVNNNAYFSYYDLGKVEYLAGALRLNEGTPDIVSVVVNINADFFEPVFYGDDIVIETCVPRVGKKSFTLVQRAINQKTGREVCRCSTVMVCYSLKAQASVEVPESYGKAIESFEGKSSEQ